jgi:hypothetical protein
MGCYPYNTPQAKRFRQAQKRLRQQAQARPNSSQPPAADSATAKGKWGSLSNQTDSLRPDTATTAKGKWGDLANKTDSSSLDTATTAKGKWGSPSGDSSLVPQPSPLPIVTQREIRFSPDSLSAPVQYQAKDSMIYDIEERRIYLYGQAEIVYERYLLKAGYIVVDFNTYTATAEGIADSTGQLQQKPSFEDGEQKFDARRIEYNFKTKKGKVYDASTRQGDGFFLSEATKFVSRGNDTTKNDVIYSGNCLYTTCNHTHPHFGIRSTKAKVIPNKLIVVGPSYLEIMGTPTPILLPFGFFPMTKTRKNGLILSTNFEMSPTIGPGIRGIGYYMQLSPKWDVTLLTDLYLRGSTRVSLGTRYNERYKSNGAVNLSFSNLIFDEKGALPDEQRLNRSFNLSWTHQQDPKAHPSQSFNAAVQFGSSDFFRLNSNEANQVLQSTFNSNISYTKRFVGTPFTLTLAATHSQNTQTRQMTLNLPRLDVRMNQIFPFKRKEAVGKERWYERITFAYNLSGQNTIVTTDTALFKPGSLSKILDTMEYNLRHSPNLNLSLKVLKHINVQPSIQYGETWYFYSKDRRFDPTLRVRFDTTFNADSTAILGIRTDTAFGQVINERNYGFHAVRDLSAGLNLNTQLFATGIYNLGRLHALWARIEPNIGFRWKPDYGSDFWGYYGKVQTDARYPDLFQTYSRFASVPAPGLAANLTYGLTMRMEAKWRKSKRDSTAKKEPFKKMVLLNNLLINGSYNMAADTLAWSVVGMNASTTLFRFINVTFNSVFDPYEADPITNARVNRLVWTERQRPIRLTSANLNASANFSSKSLRDLFGKKTEAKSTEANKNPKRDLFEGFSVNYNWVMQRRYVNQVDSFVVSAHELSLSGVINLSQNWNVRIGRIGYDFVNLRVTYPDFTFARDLHCWQMGLSWQPEPSRRTWSFFIRVKPSSLGFINVPVRKNFFDQF